MGEGDWRREKGDTENGEWDEDGRRGDGEVDRRRGECEREEITNYELRELRITELQNLIIDIYFNLSRKQGIHPFSKPY